MKLTNILTLSAAAVMVSGAAMAGVNDDYYCKQATVAAKQTAAVSTTSDCGKAVAATKSKKTGLIDFTGSLFLPERNQWLSHTQLGAGRSKDKTSYGGALEKDLWLGERLTYGVTDNFALVAGITNEFDVDGDYNNDHNFEYNVGAKYNFKLTDRVIGQVGATYNTWNPKDFYGHSSTDAHWQKNLAGNVQLGYKLDNDWTPYTSFTASTEVDRHARADSEEYSWFGGVHKLFAGARTSINAGLRYDFTTAGKNTDNTHAEGEVYYFATDNVAVGVFGDTMLSGTDSDGNKYNYTVGAQAKVLF
jgi:hypothetical protein